MCKTLAVFLDRHSSTPYSAIVWDAALLPLLHYIETLLQELKSDFRVITELAISMGGVDGCLHSSAAIDDLWAAGICHRLKACILTN